MSASPLPYSFLWIPGAYSALYFGDLSVPLDAKIPLSSRKKKKREKKAGGAV